MTALDETAAIEREASYPSSPAKARPLLGLVAALHLSRRRQAEGLLRQYRHLGVIDDGDHGASARATVNSARGARERPDRKRSAAAEFVPIACIFLFLALHLVAASIMHDAAAVRGDDDGNAGLLSSD